MSLFKIVIFWDGIAIIESSFDRFSNILLFTEESLQLPSAGAVRSRDGTDITRSILSINFQICSYSTMEQQWALFCCLWNCVTQCKCESNRHFSLHLSPLTWAHISPPALLGKASTPRHGLAQANTAEGHGDFWDQL